MCFASADITSFLVGAWSRPLRLACPSFAGAARRSAALARHPGALRLPRTPAPKWVTAQYFLRWLGEVFALRAAWQARQGGPPRYRFGRRSEPCWSQTVTLPLHPGYLRREPEEVFWFLCMNIERLYRMAQTPTEEIGPDLWMQAFLGVCQHLAQLYAALRREYQAKRARESAWQALHLFLEWDSTQEEESQTLSLAAFLEAQQKRHAPDPTPGAARDGGATGGALPVAPASVLAPGGEGPSPRRKRSSSDIRPSPRRRALWRSP